MIQVHTDCRGLVLRPPDPAAVLRAVPSAFDLGGGYVGMPHGIDEVTRLTAYCQIAAPSPIEHYYQWPREPQHIPHPFAHQITTAAFLTTNPRAYVLNDIGTGKTLSGLWAADYLMAEGLVQRALIAAPLSTLERVWADSIFYHLRHRKALVLHGSAERRRKLLAQDADFYVINHDGIAVLRNELARRPDINLYAIDELAVFRNKNTTRWKALDALIHPDKQTPKPWVWGFTGAPIPNEPTDAYAQCRLVTPTSVPKYYTSFRNMVMEHQSTYVWTPRRDAIDVVYQAMRPSIRFKRDDCLDLPGEIHTTYDVELSAEQAKHYKELMRELSTEVRGGRVTAVNEGVKLSKLLQIACGVVYDTEGQPHEIDCGTRIETLLQIIEACNEKVIVFVPFVEVTNMLYREIVKHWSCAVVYGETPVKERNQIFADFQTKEDPSVLVAHPGCMSHGLTLTEASSIVWYAPVPSNDMYQQACGRITRPGQKYVANIIHLAGSAVERKTYKRLESRTALQGLLLEMVERGEQ